VVAEACRLTSAAHARPLRARGCGGVHLSRAGGRVSTSGTFLRAFTFARVRKLDAVAARFLVHLAGMTPLLPDVEEVAYLDIDSRDQTDLRVPEAGRGVRAVRGEGAERTDRGPVHPDGGAGDRGHPAAQGLDKLPARSGPAGRRRPGHRHESWGHRERHSPGRLVLLRARGGGRGPPRWDPILGHCTRGRRSRTPARSPTRTRADGYPAFRSWDFDACIFVLLDSSTYEVVQAYELPSTSIQAAASAAPRVNGSRIQVSAPLCSLTGPLRRPARAVTKRACETRPLRAWRSDPWRTRARAT
jgi:hypothetical protein